MPHIAIYLVKLSVNLYRCASSVRKLMLVLLPRMLVKGKTRERTSKTQKKGKKSRWNF